MGGMVFPGKTVVEILEQTSICGEISEEGKGGTLV